MDGEIYKPALLFCRFPLSRRTSSSAGMRWAVFHPCPISPEPSKIGREIEKTLRMAFSSSSSRTPSRAPSSTSRISVLQPPSHAPSFTLSHDGRKSFETPPSVAPSRSYPSLPPLSSISSQFFIFLLDLRLTPSASSQPPSIGLCFFRSLLLSSRPPSVVVCFFPFLLLSSRPLEQDSWSENPWQWPFYRTFSSYGDPFNRVTDILVVESLPVDDVNLLKNKPILDRVLVISAGIVANIIFAFVIIFVQVVSVGLPILEAFPGVLVPEVRELSAAAHAGVWPGDVILGVNGALLPKSGPAIVSQVVDVIKRNPGRNALLKVGRGNGDLEINITPDENLDRTASKVSGHVAIIAVGAEVAMSSFDGLYQFAVMLNINLAVINLLQFLGLDSGTLALLLLEAARGGKKIPQEVEQGIMSSRIMVLHNNVSLLANEELEVHSISAWKEKASDPSEWSGEQMLFVLLI
ncbi:hypothetical protein ACLOJK_038573 [Asimina triloba]